MRLADASSFVLTVCRVLMAISIPAAMLSGLGDASLMPTIAHAAACSGEVEQTARQRALASSTPDAAKNYLSCFPYGDGANSVRAHERKLEEELACRKAMAATTADELRNFIMQWSQSECATRAAAKLGEINDLSIYTRYPSSIFTGAQARRGSVADEKACALACKGDGTSCVGYSFESTLRACTLWSRIDGRTPRGDAISGSTAPVAMGVAPATPTYTAPPVAATQLPPTVSSGTGSMRYLNGMDLPGGDYFNLRDVTLEQCNELCAGRNECAAFTYNTRASACFLKAATGAPVPFSGAVSGFKSTASPQSFAPRPMQIHANVDLPNPDPADDYALVRQITLQECRATCEIDNQCAAFTFNQRAQACILKRSYGRRVQFTGAVSGTK